MGRLRQHLGRGGEELVEAVTLKTNVGVAADEQRFFGVSWNRASVAYGLHREGGMMPEDARVRANLC